MPSNSTTDHHSETTPAGSSPISTPDATTPSVPVASRIVSLDVLRGFALLGIFPMNLLSFALPQAALFNPKSLEPLIAYEGLNRFAYSLNHVLFDMKMMSIFSMLFGAGVLLYARNATTRQDNARARKRWFIRCAWLLFFGLIHAYFIWYGDILVLYAICGLLVLWWVRRWPALLLFSVGTLGVLIAAALFSLQGAAFYFSKQPDTLAQMSPEEIASVNEAIAIFNPTPQDINNEIAIHRGPWAELHDYRVKMSLEMQIWMIPFWGFWRATGLMLIGMALLKWRILTAERSPAFYATLAGACYSIALPLTFAGIAIRDQYTDDVPMLLMVGLKPNELASPIMAVAHISAICLVIRLGALRAVQHALAAVGRTAFSNYILQSLIATTLFYGYGFAGYGFALFGKLDRVEQSLLVLVVWAAQIAISIAWLNHFRMGPIEWLWRTLTDFRMHPIRKR